VRFLVLDAYSAEGRQALVGVGGTAAGVLYERMLGELEPGSTIDVLFPADRESSLPEGTALGDYDGIAWTGSDLSVLRDDDPRVGRQIELAQAAFEAGVPSFGSCYGIQLSVVAAGGECTANPRGREFGLSRWISLSAEGKGHSMYRGRGEVFDAYTCHTDMVSGLPERSTLLAGNDFTSVQGLAIEHRGGSFWAVQYHPEYDLHEVAALCRLRRAELVAQGTFRDDAEAGAYIDNLEALHGDPSRRELAQELGIGAPVLDFSERTREVRNWIDDKVRPRAE